MKIVYCDKLLREDINDFLEKIEYEDVKKEYLTLDEVKRLAAIPFSKLPLCSPAFQGFVSVIL